MIIVRKQRAAFESFYRFVEFYRKFSIRRK